MAIWLVSPALLAFLLGFGVNLFVAGFWYSSYRIWNFDLAIFAQAQSDYSKFQQPIVELLNNGVHVLGNHFSPILALLAPIYAIFPHPFTLDVVQALCFGLGSFFLAKAGEKHLGRAGGYLLGFGLAVSYDFLAASSSQFHEYSVGVPILAFALYKFLDKDYLTTSLAAGLLVFVKEDQGLILLGLGLALAFRSRQFRYLLLSLWGGLWVFLSIKVIVPYFHGAQWTFSSFFEGPSALLNDPWVKLFLLGFLVVQTGIIGLRSPLIFALIPFLGARFMSSWSAYYTVTYYYDTLSMVILGFALLDVLVLKPWRGWKRYGALCLPLLLTLAWAVVPFAGHNSYLTLDYGKDSAIEKDMEAAFDAIPEGTTTVLSGDTATPYLVDRGYTVYFLRAYKGLTPAPDCIVNDSEDVYDASGEKITTLSEVISTFDRSYVPIYIGDYQQVWCASA